MRRVRWGILSTARIGTERVIPAMKRGRLTEIVAIASRDAERARHAAGAHGIARSYGTYEALLADPEIDAIYIPLPNHLHVPWAVRALEAGKHVLCEKPVALDEAEARTLSEAASRAPHLKVMEAFMYRLHPQWQRVREVIASGGIGELRAVHSTFCFFNDDPANIRNIADLGGGSLMDVGCYNISVSRFLTDAEPTRVSALADVDPRFGVDRLVSGILQFPEQTATFTCSTQMAHHQRVTAFGTRGRLEVETPFTPAPDHTSRIWHHHERGVDEILVEPANQYTLQGDAFSAAILDDTEVPTPLDDALANMRVIDSVYRSARERCWVETS